MAHLFVRILGGLTLAVSAASSQVVVSDVGDGIVRLDASASAASASLPSLALDEPRTGQGPAASPIPVSFQPSFGGSVPRMVVRVTRVAGDSVYGTGLVAGPLERTGRQVELWNTDAFGWGDGSQSLYQSHPWVLLVHADGSATGVLFDSPNRMQILATETSVTANVPALPGASEPPAVPVYVIDRAHPAEVLSGLAELTGHPFMPPLWSLGYHQSRYSYTPDARVLEVASEFRARNLPADVMWLDIDYMDGFRMFTWNPFTFPDPAGLDASLESIGFKSIAIVDPHLKLDPGYFAYQQGEALDVWVKSADGVTDFVGDVWPGASKFPDYTRSDVRGWWAGLYAPFVSIGLDGIWNDMNEPAVFNALKTMPEENVHLADAALGGPGPHARFHNVYGKLMARATRAGLLAARPGERPFVLTRANHIGGQRYAATWTGDNSSDWYHLDVSIQNVLNLGLSGQPNVGPDIGGFIGSNSGRFFARWMGFGALMPFARGHTGTGNPDKEPWVYGPEVEAMNRVALQRRYRLLPHLYTLFDESSRTGVPVMRPLFFADPSDAGLREIDDAFLLGDGLVVSAATGPGSSEPARPSLSGVMYRFGFPIEDVPDFVGGEASDICFDEQPDLYLRGGHIVPSTRVLQSTADVGGSATWDDLVLIVALDEAGVAVGEVYEDDGRSFAHESGDFLRTTYEAVRTGDTVTVSIIDEQGSRARPTRPLTVRLLLADGYETSATGVDGQAVVLTVPAGGGPVFECDPEPPVEPAAIDGRRIVEAFAPAQLRAIQTLVAPDGDNVNELNAIYAAQDGDTVRLAVPGNLVQDGHAFAVFIDSRPGGQAEVNTLGSGPPPAGLVDLTGTRFDNGFVPDELFYVNAFNGGLFVDQLSLSANEPGSKRFLGRGAVGSGDGALVNGDNPFGVLVALDNANDAGVPGDPRSAAFGFELKIPFAALGTSGEGCPTLAVCVFVVRPWGEVSNQVVPGLTGSVSTLGFVPDFGSISGEQFARFGLNPADLAAPFGGHDLSDIDAFVAAFLNGGVRADLALPAGVFDLADVDAFVSAFLGGCP